MVRIVQHGILPLNCLTAKLSNSHPYQKPTLLPYFTNQLPLAHSFSWEGILYAHVGLPRREDISEDVLVACVVDPVDGHHHFPVATVLGLEVEEHEAALVRAVVAARDGVVLKIYTEVMFFMSKVQCVLCDCLKSKKACV